MLWLPLCRLEFGSKSMYVKCVRVSLWEKRRGYDKMSKQYLEAHAFLETLRDKGVPYTETLVNLMQYAVIEDVAPVVHAHWSRHPTIHEWECSNCRGFCFPKEVVSCTARYCPECGAKMDEVIE